MKSLDLCKNIYKEFEALQRKTKGYSLRTIFDDFCSLSMASFHNSLYTLLKYPIPNLYKNKHNKFEKEFEDIRKKYGNDIIYKDMAKILGRLQLAMNENPFDYLGHIYMDMNINSKNAGQYFTPSHICEFMADIVKQDNFGKKGYILLLWLRSYGNWNGRL